MLFHLGWFGEKEDLPNILVGISPELALANLQKQS